MWARGSKGAAPFSAQKSQVNSHSTLPHPPKVCFNSFIETHKFNVSNRKKNFSSFLHYDKDKRYLKMEVDILTWLYELELHHHNTRDKMKLKKQRYIPLSSRHRVLWAPSTAEVPSLKFSLIWVESVTACCLCSLGMSDKRSFTAQEPLNPIIISYQSTLPDAF